MRKINKLTQVRLFYCKKTIKIFTLSLMTQQAKMVQSETELHNNRMSINTNYTSKILIFFFYKSTIVFIESSDWLNLVSTKRMGRVY